MARRPGWTGITQQGGGLQNWDEVFSAPVDSSPSPVLAPSRGRVTSLICMTQRPSVIGQPHPPTLMSGIIPTASSTNSTCLPPACMQAVLLGVASLYPHPGARQTPLLPPSTPSLSTYTIDPPSAENEAPTCQQRAHMATGCPHGSLVGLRLDTSFRRPLWDLDRPGILSGDYSKWQDVPTHSQTGQGKSRRISLWPGLPGPWGFPLPVSEPQFSSSSLRKLRGPAPRYHPPRDLRLCNSCYDNRD